MGALPASLRNNPKRPSVLFPTYCANLLKDSMTNEIRGRKLS
jgi:hypothetical protein